jgi:hypothetical protein
MNPASTAFSIYQIEATKEVMPRYVFTEGKVTVEEGIYDPLLDEAKAKETGVVLLVSRPRAISKRKRSRPGEESCQK